MTIHIPVKLLLFVLYTCAVLGGAFAISYAVFEWKADSPDKTEVSEVEASLEQLDDDVETLRSRISTLSSDINKGSGHSHDDCGSEISLYVIGAMRVLNIGEFLSESELDAQIDAWNQQGGEIAKACR